MYLTVNLSRQKIDVSANIYILVIHQEEFFGKLQSQTSKCQKFSLTEQTLDNGGCLEKKVKTHTLPNQFLCAYFNRLCQCTIGPCSCCTCFVSISFYTVIFPQHTQFGSPWATMLTILLFVGALFTHTSGGLWIW